MPSLLDHPVESLPGIGPTTGAQLRQRGYATVGDLLWLLPRGYDDQRVPTPIHALCDGEYAVVEGVVRGVARGCRANGCALLGGETAQMPDFYAEGEYDLAGFIVGIVSRDHLIDGSRVQDGDVLVAIGSKGLHTNGYTLARRIVFEVLGLAVDDPFPGLGVSVGEAHTGALSVPLLTYWITSVHRGVSSKR